MSKRETAADEIVLCQPRPTLGVRNASPFCLKLETWLRMAGLSYRVEFVTNPGKGPKGKIPFIRDGDTVLGDSSLIIEYLERTRGVDLNSGLTRERRATAVAVQRLLEDHLYWCLLHYRWIDDRYWPATREAFFAPLPAPLRAIVPGIVRGRTRKKTHAHGIGRHSPADILAMATTDLEAVSGLLGEKPYFLGDTPATIDAAAYGFLSNLLDLAGGTPLTEIAARHRNLVEYVARMKARYFPEDVAAEA